MINLLFDLCNPNYKHLDITIQTLLKPNYNLYKITRSDIIITTGLDWSNNSNSKKLLFYILGIVLYVNLIILCNM